jgi:hypothetical protein
MNKNNKIFFLAIGCVMLLTILVIAVAPLNSDTLGTQMIIGSEGVGSTAGFLNKNISGTVNVSFELRTPNNLSLTNVTFMWMIISNTSLNYTAANGSIIVNSTFRNNTANQTRWNYTLDTTTLLDGQYNISLMVYNISNGNGSGDGENLGGATTNLSFMWNVTVDNTPAYFVNITSPAQFPTPVKPIVNSGYTTNLTFNVTVNDTLTGVETVILQFHNGTYFNMTALRMASPSAGVLQNNLSNSRWGLSVDPVLFSDVDPLTVTVFAKDFAGSLNNTQTFSLNVDRTIPTLTLTKNSNSNDVKLVIDIATSGDSEQCSSSQGTVTGTGNTQTITSTGLTGSVGYSFIVTCNDEAGNSKTVTQSFTTDASSGGGSAAGSSSSSSSSRSSSTSGQETVGEAKDDAKQEVVEEITPPSVPTDVAAEPTPSAGAADVPKKSATEQSEGGSVVGWVIAVVVLLGLVAAYFVWSKKN